MSVTAEKGKKPVNENELLQELAPRLLKLLSSMDRVELENFEMEIGDLELWLQQGSMVPAISPQLPRPTTLFSEGFIPSRESYPGKIQEVTIGATRSDGGTRRTTVTCGGSTAPPFTFVDQPPPHQLPIALDVFDTRIPMPKTLKENIAGVMDDPVEWAKLNVQKFGADVVTIHLLSTDPLIANTSPKAAAATVENILQAVDVPLIIGGCGDPKKDTAVFTKVAEVAEGERVVLNSVTLDMVESKNLEAVAAAAKQHNQVVLAFTGLELNNAKELNRRLYESLSPDQIVMDLTTAALGYGLEYSYTIYERARHAALMGDRELQHPVISASTNAWAAREAWIQMDPIYGPKEFRGPLWETVTALALLLAGVDMFMMMHPAAVRTVREVVQALSLTPSSTPSTLTDWTIMRS